MYLHPINRREENLRLLDLLHENKWFSILGDKFYGYILLKGILTESNKFFDYPLLC